MALTDASTDRKAGNQGARFVMYSHDGVGLGHFRRNLVLAQAVTERLPGASVLMACAAEGIETFPLPAGVDVVRLPGLRKVTNHEYASRRLRIDERDVLEMRASLLASVVATFKPNVLLVDKHPLGVRRELVPALNELRLQGGRAVLGLRDVLDERARSHGEWDANAIGSLAIGFYDLVLIYGSAGFLSPMADAVLPPQWAGLVRHCGYVVGKSPATRSTDDLPVGDRPVVLATVGGGEDGLSLLMTFVDACRGADWQGIAVAGPQMPASDWDQLERTAQTAGVTALRTVRQVQRWYRRAGALVCMGGYNTLVEALAAPIPVVCVPRTQPRMEQAIRASAFAARGLLQVVQTAETNRPPLRAAIDSALKTDRSALAARVAAVLDLNGAERAADYLAQVARRPVPDAPAEPVAVPA